MISLIVAVDLNGLIGNKNSMPWHIPEELQHFKEYTLHKSLLMGRKTLESIKKPLKNRFTYVLSSKLFDFDNIEIVNDLEHLIQRYKDSDDELVVIGGAKVYETMLKHVSKMIISVILDTYEGDTYFPKFDVNEFELLSKQTHEKFIIYTLIRKEI